MTRPNVEQDLIAPEEYSWVADSKTEYVDHSCGPLCRIAYFPDAQFWVLGHWIVALWRPIGVILCFIYMTIIGYMNIHDSSSEPHGFIIAFYILLGICALCVIYSYFAVAIVGPGYLPYNYSVVHHNLDKMTWEKWMESFVVFTEQVEFARHSERPPRSSFAISARRFILRADHFCFWTESWIGIKNHRYFFNMILWSVAYCVIYAVSQLYYMKTFLNPFHWTHILTLIAWAICVVMFMFSFFHSIIHLSLLVKNRTQLEKWKKIKSTRFDKGNVCDNCAEICGPKKFIPCWLIPCIPLKPLEDGFYSTFARETPEENASVPQEAL